MARVTNQLKQIGFVGLGRMGSPMARNLARAGFDVRGLDADPAAPAALAGEAGFTAVGGIGEVAAADAVILMLPDSGVVEEVVLERGLLDSLAAGALLIDMSSSEPLRTRSLAERAAAAGVAMLDAPVSGGVGGAERATLTIMVGGPEGAVEVARPMLEALGSRVQRVGEAGAGHAVKALNNLMSATHLLVTSEALLAARDFGLDLPAVLEVVNGSSGRSGSSESKWPDFVLTNGYDSGFGMGLMVKDMRIALGLARSVGAPAALGERALELWSEALEQLPGGADHTEIVRWLEGSTVETGGAA